MYQTMRRVELVLRATVEEAEDGRFIAVVQSDDHQHLWRSVPVPSYSLAQFLGWQHLALLGARLQEDGCDADDR